MNIFAYGSLRLQVVWDLVTGKQFPTIPATLSDHVALCVKKESFPGLIPRPGSTTEGLVYLDVDEETLAVLDEFESGIYERIVVDVQSGDGQIITSYVYRVMESHQHWLEDELWNYESFRRDYLDDFIKRNIGGQ